MKIKLCMLFLLLTGICSMYAQDIIVLVNGEEIEAKVLEISSREIRYKNYNNLDGPTIVLSREDVSAINYENGTTELISSASSEPIQNARVVTSGFNPNRTTFGIFFNPLGFLQFGPMFGLSLSRSYFLANAHVRIPAGGLLLPIMFGENRYRAKVGKGVGVGGDLNFFLNRRRGGLYSGALFEYWNMTTDYNHDTYSDENYYTDSQGVVFAGHLGYRFRWSSGFFLNLGGYLGAIFYTWKSSYRNYGRSDSEVLPFGMLEFSLGFNFAK